MEKVTLAERTFYGISTRTNNAEEMSGNGKIGPLWQQFYAELGQKGIQPSTGYGVYCQYESDQNGNFDIAVALEESVGLPGEQSVVAPAGAYLKFTKSGPCPQACIELWQEIWNYFAEADAPTRSFKVDFEEYLSMTEVAIYIGIEE